MKVFDILEGKEKEVEENKLVFVEKKSEDYILSIPHSGTLIPVEFIDKFNVGKFLVTGSDAYTKEVYNTKKGKVVVFLFNNYFVNINRFREGNKDKTLPAHLQNSPFWIFDKISMTGNKVLKKKFNEKEKERILYYYDKYHNLLNKSIMEMKQKYGYALLFDCHSLNSVGLKNTPDEGEKRADFIVSTLEDTSADSKLISIFYKTLKKEAKKFNFTVKKNEPYKGGFILFKYGKPKENIHAIQIEIKKANYMNENLDGKSEFKLKIDGLKRINSIISKAIEATSKEAKKVL